MLKNIPLEIAVYPIIEEKWAYAIGGPMDAILSMENIDKSRVVKIIPGDTPKSKIARSIVNLFLKGLNEKDTAKVNATILNELITILPGDCYIKNE